MKKPEKQPQALKNLRTYCNSSYFTE